MKGKLPPEIESITKPGYSLYPDCDYSIQFLSRGCIRKCPFCVVPLKKGVIYQVRPLDLNPKDRWIMVLDNNFFSCSQWRKDIGLIRSWNQPVTFQQGLDPRIMTEEMGKVLPTLRIKGSGIYIAWDNYEDKEIMLKGIEMLAKHIRPWRMNCHALVGFRQNCITNEGLERVMILRELGVSPFAMGYINFHNPHYKKSCEIKRFYRWVNMKATFNSYT